jgi:hypothetical protein
MTPAKWAKHPDVELDSDVADFYFELMAWVRRRRAAKPMTHYTEAPKHLDWPDIEYDERAMDYLHGQRYSDELPYLDWRRPAKHQVDPNRRLLGTGRYADEEEPAYIIPPQKPQPAPAPAPSFSPDTAATAAPTTAAKPTRRTTPRRPKRTAAAAPQPNKPTTTRQRARRAVVAPGAPDSDSASASGKTAPRPSHGSRAAVGRRGKHLRPQQQQEPAATQRELLRRYPRLASSGPGAALPEKVQA